MEIPDTNFWFSVAKDPILSRNTKIRQTSTLDDIINMLEFLVDNNFMVFGGKVFQQIVGIPMGTIVPLF